MQEGIAICSLRQTLSLIHEGQSKAIGVAPQEAVNFGDQVGLQFALTLLDNSSIVTYCVMSSVYASLWQQVCAFIGNNQDKWETISTKLCNVIE